MRHFTSFLALAVANAQTTTDDAKNVTPTAAPSTEKAWQAEPLPKGMKAQINADGCEEGWKRMSLGTNDACFKYAGYTRADQAVSTCGSLDAELPIPKNADENSDFKAIMAEFNIRSAHMNGNDVMNEGQWVDSSGQPLSYFQWNAPWQPDNWYGLEDYIHIYTYSNYIAWNDHFPWNYDRVICQKDTRVGEGWNICPSNHHEGGCYTQSNKWTPNAEVSCEMTNSDCLSVSCTSDSIKSSFRADLFHTNLENDETFMQQLKDGHRTIEYNGAPLQKGDACGYTTTANSVVIEWNYALCGVAPTMVGNQIVYSVSLSSPGNAPGYPTVEFYVDTAVEASCSYDSKVVVEADGFWVNQEDVNAAADAQGTFEETFDCKFYADANYQNQILSNNIVNMGEMIYGQVESEELAGLSYNLVGVTVTNANDEDMSYAVINGGVPSPDVKASSEGNAQTGQSLNFSYLSFGFESATGTNQNEINIQCAVELSITPDRPGLLVGGDPCTRGPSYWCASAENAAECGVTTCQTQYGATW